VSAPAIRKAPTASAKPPAGARETARKAAPGVDHATEEGCRVTRLITMAVRPIESEAAIRPELASDGVAPIAVRP